MHNTMGYRQIYAARYLGVPIITWAPNCCGVIPLYQDEASWLRLADSDLDLGAVGPHYVLCPPHLPLGERRRWFEALAAEVGIVVKWVESEEGQAQAIQDDMPQWRAWREALDLPPVESVA